MNVGAMGVFYGYSFWMDRILAMNMGMWVLWVCFTGTLFGWTELYVAMNVGIMGVLYGHSFGWTENFGNECRNMLCAMDVLCGLFWMW
jgi:hypothetical protein